MASTSPPPPIVEVVRLSKRFGATQALDDVSLALEPGEVHALVGENGAGKSTLGKMIAGVYRPDRGEVWVDGRPVGRWDPTRAQRVGVVILTQELSLVPDRTVAENVFLGREPRTLGILRGGLRSRYAELERRCRFGLHPDALVDDLRIADQQKVEIMRALARDARVLVLDEPTSALTADQAAKLHNVIAGLRSEGRTIVYVTHFLDEVMQHTDRVTVMRDGRVVRTARTAQESKQSLVEAMLGRSLEVTFPLRPPAPSPDVAPIVQLRGVRSGAMVRSASLEIRPGEIVGLAGLVGSGRSEIGRVIFGVDRVDEGTVVVGGPRHGRNSARRSIRERVALIPEDRRGQGLVLIRPVRENVSLPHLGRFSRRGVLTRRRERSDAARLVERLGVQPPRLDGDLTVLSGGNQQKVLFAKWMMGEPRVIVLDEPTRGIDIGAKHRIYEVIVELARSGAAVLLISSELEEVMELSHRVYLVRQGEVVGEVDPTTTTVDNVLFRLFQVRDTQAGK